MPDLGLAPRPGASLHRRDFAGSPVLGPEPSPDAGGRHVPLRARDHPPRGPVRIAGSVGASVSTSVRCKQPGRSELARADAERGAREASAASTGPQARDAPCLCSRHPRRARNPGCFRQLLRSPSAPPVVAAAASSSRVWRGSSPVSDATGDGVRQIRGTGSGGGVGSQEITFFWLGREFFGWVSGLHVVSSG